VASHHEAVETAALLSLSDRSHQPVESADNSPEQRRHSLRMESVGRLAGGISHDFNNMLTVILGCAEQLQREIGDHPILTEMRHAATSAAGLTRQLLAFSRQQHLQRRSVNVAAIVRDMTPLLMRVLGNGVSLRIESGPDLPHVIVDPAQLENVLMNLAINARDAMPNGGTLDIEVRRTVIEAPLPDRAVQPTGEYVQLSVRDSGVGIPRELVHRIFEPFYTTKGASGTGLGLSTVYGIVKQSGGYIWVESEPGAGTTFTIDLPVATADEIIWPDPAPLPLHTARSRTATILLVEDVDAVRTITRDMLESAGYTVLEAASPADALQLVLNDDRPIDLLLSDVMMPGMSGGELATAVQQHMPDIGVLFMSGVPSSLEWNRSNVCLAKPFTRALLLSHVRAELEGH